MNAVKSSIPFGRMKRPHKAWWSAEVEQAVSERRKAFDAAHRSDEDRLTYISASRRTSSVIAKAKTEAWQTTCFSLLPRSNPKSVCSLLCYIAGSPSSSTSSPSFPNCSSRESVSVYAAYLRSHFSVSQPKAPRSRARGYLSELRRATCSVESHSSFCSPFSPRGISCGCLQSYPIHCHWPRQSCLSHAKAPSSLWHGFSSSHFQSFLVFTFLSFHLEDIFYYSHPQDGKASRVSCFLPAYLSHLPRIKAV